MEKTEIPKEDKKEVVPEKSEVEKVKENLTELKEANDATEAELLRGEQLRAKVQKGGKSEAGSEVSTKTQDELDEEAAKTFMQDDE